MANKTINLLTASSATLSLNDLTILYGTSTGSGLSTRKATFGKIVDDLKLVKNYANTSSTNLLLQNTSSQNSNSSLSLGSTGEVNINGTSININGSSSVNIDNIPIPNSNLKAANKIYVDNNINPLTLFKSDTFDGYGTKGRGYLKFPVGQSIPYFTIFNGWTYKYGNENTQVLNFSLSDVTGTFDYDDLFLDITCWVWDNNNLSFSEIQDIIEQEYSDSNTFTITKIENSINQTRISDGEWLFNYINFYNSARYPTLYQAKISYRIILDSLDREVLLQGLSSSTLNQYEVHITIGNATQHYHDGATDDEIILSNGAVSLTEETQAAGITEITNLKWYKIQPECLPIATADSLGAVKIGEGITISSLGKINWRMTDFITPIYQVFDIPVRKAADSDAWHIATIELPSDKSFMGVFRIGNVTISGAGVGWRGVSYHVAAASHYQTTNPYYKNKNVSDGSGLYHVSIMPVSSTSSDIRHLELYCYTAATSSIPSSFTYGGNTYTPQAVLQGCLIPNSWIGASSATASQLVVVPEPTN